MCRARLLQRLPSGLLFGVGLMDEKRVSLRAHFAGAAWLLGLRCIYRSRHYQGSDALKKGRSGSQASMSAHDRAIVAYVGIVEQLNAALLREAIRPFRSVPRCG